MYVIENVNAAGKYVNVAGGSTSNGANIQLWDSATESDSRWCFKEKALGVYTIESMHAAGKYLNAATCGISANGTNVRLWDNPESYESSWRVREVCDGVYTIENCFALKKYVTVSLGSTANAANILLWNNPESPDTQWRIIKQELVPPDAPVGHMAWSEVVYKEPPDVARACAGFKWRGHKFQTTLMASGTRSRAERIARACYMRLQSGVPYEEVLQFRTNCYARLQGVPISNLVGQTPGGSPMTSTAGTPSGTPRHDVESLTESVAARFLAEPNMEVAPPTSAARVHSGLPAVQESPMRERPSVPGDPTEQKVAPNLKDVTSAPPDAIKPVPADPVASVPAAGSRSGAGSRWRFKLIICVVLMALIGTGVAVYHWRGLLQAELKTWAGTGSFNTTESVPAPAPAPPPLPAQNASSHQAVPTPLPNATAIKERRDMEKRLHKLQGQLGEQQRRASAAENRTAAAEARKLEVRQEESAVQAKIAQAKESRRNAEEEAEYWDRRRARLEEERKAESEARRATIPGWLDTFPNQGILAAVFGVAGFWSIVGPSSYTHAFSAFAGSTLAGLILGSSGSVLATGGGDGGLAYCTEALVDGRGDWVGYTLWSGLIILGMLRWYSGYARGLQLMIQGASNVKVSCHGAAVGSAEGLQKPLLAGT